ncbi:polysaccharide biosynthesis/export family protein [Novosphingobium album (ex Liu et al. 2023)]|uniref:Polysaccharide biosynthesis/export family protein n=1 Tax=Novosphingobium album (ex Liu et al. 2023) TaxID=3031130 RepID=A0ABT5WKC1_9SPHN|nr:polysaccharide biosynthesis/export family protein [Novosphingobium album (ex Liu et al. 2023)]MDE8650476.1 polysaccharide biosynthesis/export family protein [Novosphingobium album (ex Liu et al. 2023)]
MAETFPVPTLAQAMAQLRLKPYDTVIVRVYQEPQLGVENGTIDAAGNLVVPILGEVPAAGRSPYELSQDIAGRLGANLLRHPNVTVERTGGLLDRVTVTGAVKNPGVYTVKGPATLVDVLALAEGTTNVARRSDVAIIRQVDGRRAGAIFDLAAIERGEADDPAVLPADKIVVGTSAIRQGYRDLLTATPLIGIAFRYF